MNRFLGHILGQSGSLPLQLLYLAGGILVGILGNAFYDSIVDRENPDLLRSVLIAAIMLLALYLLFILFFRGKKSYLEIDQGEHVAAMPYLISGLSWLNITPDESVEAKEGRLSNVRSIFNLVEKHQPLLKCLFLIESEVSGVQRSKAEFLKWCEEQKQQPGFHPYEVKYIKVEDGYDMGEIYRVVHHKLDELEKNGVHLGQEVLLDVTAGTAAMSAGLTMAALSNGCNITYQASGYGDRGQLKGKTKWQLYKNHIVQLWESLPKE